MFDTFVTVVDPKELRRLSDAILELAKSNVNSKIVPKEVEDSFKKLKEAVTKVDDLILDSPTT